MDHSIYRGIARALGIAGLAALGLQGCASTAGQQDGAAESAAGEGVAFPELDRAWVEEGAYVNMENLRKMQVGVSKNQIYDLLGRPHFKEGLFGVRQWNYIFHLPTEEGGYITCQYQVRFDDDMLSESMHWREPQCADLLNPRPDEPTRMTLEADTLFDFDSAELSPKGQKVVADLGRRIRGEFVAPAVLVVGHTDRLGSDAYNQTLSEQRAETVRTALANQGIPNETINSSGAGERYPVTQCEGARATPELKECLRPNRRVSIEVSGEKR
ncbi:OmpA/MotB domain protein [Alloalcanivorax dieselolei B5]|uniref:OmpA/MotB domain protein n=1 Tax=Alcanivorax dieselolei (strain DSM 16502 / CGMCC 1.3690 / MCCC 1A00001 / B-5) TaxID=930169 RepID=K0CA42_ALCDB|nr:OmpA family protein [Alloalcanivorax dieselolei]AFT70429.1 OmpA/MotB domain protein [Alloalcanivorax dieselolei B5]GGJ84212.1 OmpA family protein [Alloalcanivorax dieselolei]